MVKVGLSPEVNALATVMIAVLLLGLLLNSVTQALLKKRAANKVKSYF
jgi:ABC-type spermidine/putrescine transport system permease subunit II